MADFSIIVDEGSGITVTVSNKEIYLLKNQSKSWSNRKI
jgi:hypothetical protein